MRIRCSVRTKPSHSISRELQQDLLSFVEQSRLFNPDLIPEAAEYLFHQLGCGNGFVQDKVVQDLKRAFEQHLQSKQYTDSLYQGQLRPWAKHPFNALRVIRGLDPTHSSRNMGRSSTQQNSRGQFLPGKFPKHDVVNQSVVCPVEDMVGSHDLIQDKVYTLHYCQFMTKLRVHQQTTLPKFHEFQTLRNSIVTRMSQQLRLDEFKPRVMTTFVRNQLIDKIYLPLIGDDLAKQIGAEGDCQTHRSPGHAPAHLAARLR